MGMGVTALLAARQSWWRRNRCTFTAAAFIALAGIRMRTRDVTWHRLRCRPVRTGPTGYVPAWPLRARITVRRVRDTGRETVIVTAFRTASTATGTVMVFRIGMIAGRAIRTGVRRQG